MMTAQQEGFPFLATTTTIVNIQELRNVIEERAYIPRYVLKGMLT